MDQNSPDDYRYTTFNNQPPTYSQQQNPFVEMPMQPVAPPKTNGKAIAALVLGILAIFIPYVGFILGIVAIIIASLSFKELKRTGEQGKGLAIAGLVCGIVGTVIYAILIFIIVLAVVLVSTSPDMYTNF
ncbi:hypothetical protein D3C81_1297800 [compost metagenome]